MDQKLKSNLTSSKHWLRFVYMVLFAIFLQVAITVMWVLVVIQFLFALVTGNDNIALRKVCDSLSTYIYQIIRFLTYNSEEKPFPFNDWPSPTVVEPEVSDAVTEPEVTEPEVTAAEAEVSEAPEPELQKAEPEPQKTETQEPEKTA